VAHLAEQGVPLEVCPTSNLRLGVYAELSGHPLRSLRESGAIVTINSDDPPLFGTTLEDEVLLLDSAFGLDVDTIDAILLDGVHHSFLPPERKRSLEQRFRAEMAALKSEHLAGE
jgi:adenosine deaminase